MLSPCTSPKLIWWNIHLALSRIKHRHLGSLVFQVIAIPIGRLSSNEDRIGSPAQLPNRAPAIAGITSTRDHRYRSLQGGVFRGVGFIHTHAKPVTLVSTRCFRLSASTGHLSGTYTGSRGGISIPRLVFPAAQLHQGGLPALYRPTFKWYVSRGLTLQG